MSEQMLRERLTDLVDQPPAMRHGTDEAVRLGRRRLRVRRAVGAAGTVAVVAVVLAGGTAVSGLLRGTDHTGVARDGNSLVAADPLSAAGIVERCTKVDNGALDATTFGPGSRVITSDVSPSGEVSAVVLSSDGGTWGQCWLSGDPGSEFNGSASAYPMAHGDPGASHQETAGMGFGRGHFTYVDRFPSDVTRVTVQVAEDKVVSAPAVNGFVAFARDVPGLTMNSSPTLDVTLYGEDGTVLADKAMARSDNSLPREYMTLVPAQPLPAGGANR